MGRTGWLLDLADRAIHAIQLLDGDPPQVAVWTDRHVVSFYDQVAGTFCGSLSTAWAAEAEPEQAARRAFLETLRAPNGAYLPVVDTGRAVIHTSRDGRLHLLQYDERRLVLEMDGYRGVLARDGAAPLVATALDRELGTVAALSADGQLHIYQQHVYVGAFPVEVRLDGSPVHLFLPDGSGTVCLADSASLRVLDLGGTVQQTAALATPAGVVCWMPDGAWVVTGEPEQGMIRLYDAQLTLARQGSAERLLDRANLVQLFVMMPDPGAQLTAIALANDGTLAFALGGLLCVTQAAELVPQPQPRPLF
ncbi:MAG: hypothetical protein GXY36_04535 [Chloroflexi bacterium]|nr:hypothetical protein [Chloroflexota bacterium]